MSGVNRLKTKEKVVLNDAHCPYVNRLGVILEVDVLFRGNIGSTSTEPMGFFGPSRKRSPEHFGHAKVGNLEHFSGFVQEKIFCYVG